MSAGPETRPAVDGPWVVIGSGFVGSAVTTFLRALDIPVQTLPAPRLIADPSADADALAVRAQRHPETERLADALAGADLVVLAAGLAQPDARPSCSLFGANALLPGVVAVAAQRQSVRRFVHLSSAAVQGRTRVLTESPEVAPFSAYSRSKAQGEAVVTRVGGLLGASVMVRATSVQGTGRPTTDSLRHVAGSRLASVARPGNQPSAVSSLVGLCRFIHYVGMWTGPVPRIVLQPWEGMSVQDVLTLAGGRRPVRLPRWSCVAAVTAGYGLSRLVGGSLDGLVRRIEAMWFGQTVAADWAYRTGFGVGPGRSTDLATALAGPSGQIG